MNQGDTELQAVVEYAVNLVLGAADEQEACAELELLLNFVLAGRQPLPVDCWFLAVARVERDDYAGRGFYVFEPSGQYYMNCDGKWTYGIQDDEYYFWPTAVAALERVQELRDMDARETAA